MSNRPFIAARIEESISKRIEWFLRRLGWRETIIAYIGYGTPDHIRVLARVVLAPERSQTQIGRAAEDFLTRRGWRNFITAACVRAKAQVVVNGSTLDIVTDRGGYLDIRIREHGLEPGWGEIILQTPESDPVAAPVLVVSEDQEFGIISDVDDTVISTSLPRPLIAAFNSFVLTEGARRPVPGMDYLYSELLSDNEGAPLIYVSTGAWNTLPFLNRFICRHGLPTGPMLLTDWGPTNTGWFRSGADHKRKALRELARDFPNIKWVLVGDDGQHDPQIYREFAELQSEHVRAIAIRELSPAEQVLAHGTTTQLPEHNSRLQWSPEARPVVRAGDGRALLSQLRTIT